MKRLLLLLTLAAVLPPTGSACTGISLTARDGSYVQARTIEWAQGPLDSYYTVIPRGERLRSDTPQGESQGLAFTARYGMVGLAVVKPDYVAEGLNEAGLSAGLFFFPGYGSYAPFDAARADSTLADLQVVQWMLARFATVDEVMAHIGDVRIAGLAPGSVVHWRIGDASGRQVVLELTDGVPRFFENTVGVLTNAPGFEWQLTNLNNYVNLFPGNVKPQELGGTALRAFGGGSGLLGLPGDATPPSRFVRAFFLRATAPQQPTGQKAVMQCFQILRNFDIPVGIDHETGSVPDIPSATQWTSAIDLSARRVYYHTAYNSALRCIDLRRIDFTKVKRQSHPLDRVQEQPVEMVEVR